MVWVNSLTGEQFTSASDGLRSLQSNQRQATHKNVDKVQLNQKRRNVKTLKSNKKEEMALILPPMKTDQGGKLSPLLSAIEARGRGWNKLLYKYLQLVSKSDPSPAPEPQP